MRKFAALLLCLLLSAQAMAGGPFPPPSTTFGRQAMILNDAAAGRTLWGLSSLATQTTSAGVTGAITGETGTGGIVCETSPTIAAPTVTGNTLAENLAVSGALQLDTITGVAFVNDSHQVVSGHPGTDFSRFAPVTLVHGANETYFGLLAESDAERGTALLAAAAAAADGELIRFRGTFDVGASQLDLSGTITGISMRGDGWDHSVISGSRALASGAVVRPGCNSELAAFKVVASNVTYGIPVGVTGSDSVVVGLTIRNVATEGNSDGFFFQNEFFAHQAILIGCRVRSKYDCINNELASGGQIDVYDPDFVVAGPFPSDSTRPARAVVCSIGGTTRVFGGSLVATNGGTGGTWGLYNDTSTCLLYGTKISTSGGTGVIYDIGTSNNNVTVDAATGYDAAKTFGTIVNGKFFGVTPTTAFLSMADDTTVAAIRTTLGALAGGDIDTLAELFALITNEGAGVATAAANPVDAANGFATYDAEVAALRPLTSAANKLPYYTGSGAAALADYTAAGRALDDDSDSAAQRVTLGVNWYTKSLTPPTGASGSVNPLDATTYYLMPGTVTTSGAQYCGRIYADKTGTVSAVRFTFYAGAAAGSAETYSLLMAVNGGAFATVSSAISNGAGPFTVVNVTGLATAVSAGDYVTFRLDTPTWTTNPTSTNVGVDVTFSY